MPVLTAHPTEVMRKSMLDHRNRIAALMRMRDAGPHETPEGELIEQAIARQIALLWQTRALRRERLYVADEVDTALAYLRDIFLPVVPSLYARWERAARHAAARASCDSAAGSAAIATATRTSPPSRCAWRWAAPAQTVLADYLERLNAWARSCRSRASWRRSEAVRGAGRGERR